MPGAASLGGGLRNLQAAVRGDGTNRNSYPLSATESFSLIFKTISKRTSVLQRRISAQKYHQKHNLFFF